MVSCKHCSTQNSLDSTFCKRCGTSLNEDAIKEAQAKMDALLEEGNAFFNQGRTEEAMAVADAAVTANPSSASALSLKALCHERKGEIAEALECAERIVELNPDSELDKIKRNALRTRLQSDLRVPEAPDRKVALLGAFSAVILVACVGVIIARVTSRPVDSGVALQTPEVVNPSTTFDGTNPGNATANSATGNPNPAPAGSNTNSNPAATDPSLATKPGVGDVPAETANNRTNSRATSGLPEAPSTLPLPDGQGGVVEPFKPNIEPIRNNSTVTPTDRTATVVTPKVKDPDPELGTTAVTPEVVPPRPSEDTGHIEITVRNSGTPRAGGGREAVTGNGLETLLRVGSQQYQLGNYAAAARSYEQALGAGGDSVILNQRLGQAYSQLGRTGDAAESFRRCVQACDAAIASGRGDKTRLATIRESADQALKVLQGG